MWNRHSVKDEPSEVNTPNVWVRIREQNQIRRLERNHPQSPEVKPVPVEWLNALVWLFVFTYFNAVMGLAHL